ncbi:MAG: hypothetical protein PCFJNLEI_00681 [Verrucomicrobiae bacterium]|nr:hypothetical protein [Verrucomicrobiae bacterium]
MNEPPKRSELVAEYQRKPKRKFLQIDAWREDEPRMYEPHYTDEDGDVTQATNGWELRNTNCPVRIQIPVNADKELVLELLKKIHHKLETGWWEQVIGLQGTRHFGGAWMDAWLHVRPEVAED